MTLARAAALLIAQEVVEGTSAELVSLVRRRFALDEDAAQALAVASADPRDRAATAEVARRLQEHAGDVEFAAALRACLDRLNRPVSDERTVINVNRDQAGGVSIQAGRIDSVDTRGEAGSR
ncbi:hypothetical protein F0L68_27300 [Solihabitans fulvus]|uniref:Uncharacterized protein n=1 Tax=Solihabitans fulvus TaxID=1892852 RepID=A0A5B2WYV6_9PSEU|nr:hypothetical protein [Solihabitans fulvus]KAA2255902.1 hypothetical protein F0L68_27300 [Solihabitans fulvus]